MRNHAISYLKTHTPRWFGLIAAVFGQSLFFLEIAWSANTFDAGTAEYTESESKAAYLFEQGKAPIAQIKSSLYEALSQSIKSQAFEFPKLLGQSFKMPQGFNDFVFRDFYFDSPNQDILKSRGSYRLRYRFSGLVSYYLFEKGLAIPSTYPSRCEVQFKGPYAIDLSSSKVAVPEYRFEFRNESSPFNINQSAPPPPWPVSQFLQHAASGRFETYSMMPFQAAKDATQMNTLSLAPAMEVVTQRHRLHLEVANPWGKFPNPGHVIIVSVDHVRKVQFHNKPRDAQPLELVEIEVEFDRNTKVTLDGVLRINPKDYGYGETYVDGAIKFSAKARQAILKDQEFLGHLVVNTLTTLLGQPPLKADYKYSRISRLQGRSGDLF